MKDIPFQDKWTLQRIREAINGAIHELNDNKLENIPEGYITSDLLLDDIISTSKIYPKAVSDVKIIDDNITEIKLADESIGSSKIGDFEITEAHIKLNSITPEKIDITGKSIHYPVDDLSISNDIMEDGAITTPTIKNQAIDSEHIVDLSIDSLILADGSVTGVKIADSNITVSKILPDIRGHSLSENSIIAEKIQDGSIPLAKLESGIRSAHVLEDGADLNNYGYSDTGKCFFIDTGINISNLPDVSPTAEAYMLEVKGADPVQIVTRFGSKALEWIRNYNNTTEEWTDWTRLGVVIPPHYDVTVGESYAWVFEEYFNDDYDGGPLFGETKYKLVSTGSVIHTLNAHKPYRGADNTYEMTVYATIPNQTPTLGITMQNGLLSTYVDDVLISGNINYMTTNPIDIGGDINAAVDYHTVTFPLVTTGPHTIKFVFSPPSNLDAIVFQIIGDIISPTVKFIGK